ncbi:MAG TPA: N-acetylmuramoyl-L-alanine amidase [Gemmatimonadales bacterium]|nr:N-acetylmuramoyl-L-alanine amidase [Gemmatimonadales bacterium]
MTRRFPLLLAGSFALACSRPAVTPPMQPLPADSSPAALIEAAAGDLPEVDSVIGPLQLRVQYPAANAVVDAGDSSFVFGTTGTGNAALTINGAPVRVAPNGAWLAWVALPRDSVMRLELRARTPADSQRLTLTLRRPRRFQPPAVGAWIDTASLAPTGLVEWPAGEFLALTARATPGAQVRLVQDGTVLATFAPDSRLDDVAWGIRAFDRDTQNLARRVADDRHVALLRGRALADSGLVLEAISGADTARFPWRLQLSLLDSLPRVVELADDRAQGGDGVTIGRAHPGATYHWFWPAGTRALVTGRINGDLRIGLAPGLHAWVPAADAHPIAGPAPRPVAGSLTLTPTADLATLRVPLSERAPFEIVEREREIEITIFGAVGDVNWIRYGQEDPLVSRIAWTQLPEGVRLTLYLSSPVWGFRSRWDRGDLLVEIRRPPPLERGRPFDGLLIAVDPGHPPAGASGPTGLTEAEANLGVALELQKLLTEAGAEVLMTRTTDSPVDLGARPRLAEARGAHLLVSIHNNALPDGVNPFPNNGTSVFYNHPRSIPLAAAVQRALVGQLGLRDLGIGRGDLALVRPTWMPAILTEGLFMMVPEQEAALRSGEGRLRYARGVFEGIREFLRERAAEP